MTSLEDNQDVASFLVTKHAWKGKYMRVFSVGTHGVTTYHPEKLDITNRWAYSDIIKLSSAKHSNQNNNHDFQLVFLKKDRKQDSMKFSSEHKCLILTEAYKFRNLFYEKPKEVFRFQVYKHHWSGTRLPIVLEVGPCALEQLDPSSHTILAIYPYSDIQGILPVRDIPGGFVLAVGGYSRLHLFSNAMDHQQIINRMLEMANIHLNINIKVLSMTTTITMDDYHNQRFGKYSGDLHQTSLSEFLVHKVNPARYMEPMRRTLCLSDTCVLERDVQTYSVVCLRPLTDVYALVRDIDNLQKFSIEYINGHTRTYISDDRDGLLASLLDGVRSAGQRDVHVRSTPTPRGYRLGPLHTSVDEETESNHLRLFQNPYRMSMAEVIERFNANVGYSGLIYSVSQDRLFAENKEKLILGALSSLVNNTAGTNLSNLELEAQFHALRRLCASKVGFAAFTTLTGFREWVGGAVVAALRRGGAGGAAAALEAAAALLHPMHADPDLRQEQLNKASMLANAAFLDRLLTMWTDHIKLGSGALVVAAMLDFLSFALCAPFSETTDGRQFDALLDLVAARGRVLFKLFEHPSMAIVKGAGLVMRALVEEGGGGVGTKMQALALAEAALPRHLLTALYSGARLQHRQLARHLLALWLTDHPPAEELLRRIIPSGLLAFLEAAEAPPASSEEVGGERDNVALAAAAAPRAPHWQALERQLKYVEKHLEHYAALAVQHWAASMGTGRAGAERTPAPQDRPVVLRRRRTRLRSRANWPMFYYQFQRDHALPNLIWNHTTREELRNALENEVRAFTSDRELAGAALTSWNHAELELHYQCLQNELKIGDYYLRILLEHQDRDDSPIRKSYEFFNDLYHRFLSTPKVEMKCMCLQAMSIVYGRYFEDIGPFADTKYIVQMLDRTCDKMERDRLVQFLSKLILHKRNVSELLEWNGIRILVELMTLAHLHTSRALVPAQSNVLESGPTHAQDADREWYYNLEQPDKPQRVGPISLQQLKDLYKSGEINNKTKCWAHGMEGWRALAAIPQLKWSLAARGMAVWDDSELAANILRLLVTAAKYYPSRDSENAIIRPLPKIKRLLSESICLSHVVQLLLTFDPVLVEMVATLLYEIMQDNPEISKLYLTGVFYFMLLYTGSNLLPIAKFLRLTHLKQAFRTDQSSSDIMQRSILGQLLPDAMVSYLENHGAEKFAQIFLGEYDTPEAIWNSEMRQMLMMKIAAHIGEFTPRLRANVAARYPYLCVPCVRYPQLQHELYCDTFYLRHLCDAARFPAWPVPDPVKLVRDVLAAWRREVERRPAMSARDACAVLGLPPAADDAAVRRAYYRLAQKYHPDKNPDGRDQFEAVNQAYEFLCSRNVWNGDGPNTDNIVLILRTQTILFERYSEILSPYKYAGYPQLLATARLEVGGAQLFAQEGRCLLPAACELALATVRCSALNADELRREGGLQVLHAALSRCVGVLSAATAATADEARVCAAAARCVALSARDAAGAGLAALADPGLRALPQDLVPLLRHTHLCDVALAGAEAVAALAGHGSLRARLVRAGALRALLPLAARYDYTLREADLATEPGANKQDLANKLAEQCITALAALYGPHSEVGEEDARAAAALDTALTPHLCKRLADPDPHQLLKILTSNWRTPYLVWDNSTRAELKEVLEKSQQPEETGPLLPEFTYTAHENLVPVGGVYIDIYIEQPEFPIENPEKFVLDLLQYISENSQAEMDATRVERLTMALTALANVIVKNPGVETKCIGHFKLLLTLLSLRAHACIQEATLRVIQGCAGSRQCLEDLAAQNSLGHLVMLVGVRPPPGDTLATLAALLANTSIVKEVLAKGAVIYLLDHFLNSKVPEVREASVDLLAKMMAEKLHGPKVRLTISRYVPGVFAEAMAAGAGGTGGGTGGGAAVVMADAAHEHPELVWSADTRAAVATHLAALRDRHQSTQVRDPNAIFVDQETVEATSAGEYRWCVPGEIVVAGVYLRLFLQNPAWSVRAPNKLLLELLTETTAALPRDHSEGSRGAVCAAALCALLSSRPSLCGAAAASGALPRLLALLPRAPARLLPVLAALAANQACVMALAQTDVMANVKSCIKSHPECSKVACEALHSIFTSSCNTDPLILQALECDLLGSLLGLLESGGGGGALSGVVAGALQAMCGSAQHGAAVRGRLSRAPVWAHYASQRHDLFITAAQHNHALDGVPQSAGYLTAPPTNIPAQPPPID